MTGYGPGGGTRWVWCDFRSGAPRLCLAARACELGARSGARGAGGQRSGAERQAWGAPGAQVHRRQLLLSRGAAELFFGHRTVRLLR